jgi:ribosomal protein S12 methylthiotransferase
VQVDAELKERRRDELISLQQRIGERWAKSMIGRTLDVLVDGVDEEGVMVGRTEWDAPDIDNLVLLTDSGDPAIPRLEAGQMRRVRIDDHITFDLVGQPVE